jgi:hypothetical protein
MTQKEYKIKLIEKEIRDIYAKDEITREDIKRANILFKDWKTLTGWIEDTRNPIRPY